MLPNFFLEVKGPDGTSAVVTRSACYNGALKARAMHSLQTSKISRFTITMLVQFTGRHLQAIYHSSYCQRWEWSPEYIMTQLKGYSLMIMRPFWEPPRTGTPEIGQGAEGWISKMIDSIPLIFRMLQSSAHRGMAYFTDQPGRNHAHGDPTFPSDFYVLPMWEFFLHVFITPSSISAVFSVWEQSEPWKGFHLPGIGAVTLQIQEIIQEKGANASLRKLLRESGPPFQANELVLHDESHIFLLPSSIRDQERNIFLDYRFQNGHSQSHPRPVNRFLVRRVVNGSAISIHWIASHRARENWK